MPEARSTPQKNSERLFLATARVGHRTDTGPAVSPSADPRRPLRLVVCDDAEDTRELLADVLRGEGHDVTVTSDGYSAINAIAEVSPDAALIDIGLPDISGYEVARAVRSAGNPTQPRLVAVTGYGSAADRAAAYDAGFDAHLTKPANLRALLDAIYGRARDAP
jgi:CheY-like chemotaxis protein